MNEFLFYLYKTFNTLDMQARERKQNTREDKLNVNELCQFVFIVLALPVHLFAHLLC